MKELHFMIPYNFGGLPPEFSDYEKSEIAILPVPYDATTSYKPGTREGPVSIILASRFMEMHDEETGRNISDKGICTLGELEPVISPKEMIKRVKECFQQLTEDNKKPVMLGGEHSITLGAVQALKEKHKDMVVLQFDAHADLKEELLGSSYAHGCVAKRISELCPIVQFGIRSYNEEESKLLNKGNITTITIAEVQNNPDRASEQLSSRIKGKEVYITLDLDCLDPSIMPAVGTPEPNGLQYKELMEIIEAVSSCTRIVGFDIVELCPIPGLEHPNFTAAKIAKRLMLLL